MDIKQIRIRNLRRILDDFEGGREEFAKKVGYSDVNYLNQLLTGHGSFGTRTAKKISRALNKDDGWLDRVHESAVGIMDYNVSQAQQNKTDVPLISWVQAGEWSEAIDMYSVGYAEEFITRISGGDNVYALRVRGHSMTAPLGSAASFPEGMIIHVDPDQQVKNNDFVIAKVNGSDQVTFKQYKEDDQPFLFPLNPDYKPIFDKFKIIGRVVGASIKF